MFRYNPKANYQPNGGHYLQILSGKDLYKQTIVVSAGGHDDTFPARFPSIFVDYSLGQMRVGDKVWMNWNKASLKLWQTQLNFVVFCASSACGVSSAHLNYTGLTKIGAWCVMRSAEVRVRFSTTLIVCFTRVDDKILHPVTLPCSFRHI